MVRKVIKHLLMRRYFWRNVGFDELSELYVSSMLRVLAVSMLMVFIPFYLYQHGYAVWQICALFGFFFVGKAICDIGSSYYVARFGPKHTMIISCFLQIVASALFLSVPLVYWPIWVLGPVYGAAASFFFIAYHVEFSKIKHTQHAGKEIGTMQIFEKVAAVLGPFLGGVVGTQFGAQYIFLVATIVLFASLWPLFRTQEPVQTRQRLRYRDLPISRLKQDLVSYVSLGVENTICINLWPFYIALFAVGSMNVYATLGLLTSLAVLISIVAAHLVGHMVDKRNARQVLRWSAITNGVLYLFRPFVHSAGGAFAINTANEIVTTGYRLPYLKGMYAAADDLPGLRIVYIASMECSSSIAKATAWLLLTIVALTLTTHALFVTGFAIAGLMSLGIMTEKFKALGI